MRNMMTEFVVSDCLPPRAASAPLRLWRVILRWLDRARQRDALSELDERLLADIGVSPGEAAAEAKKPMWTD